MEKAHAPFTPIYLGRFSFLFVSIILSFVLIPFLEGFVGIKILMDIFLSVILISAINTISRQRRTLIIALALACPCLIFKWSNYLLPTPLLWDLTEVFGALFTVYVLISIWSFIIRQQEVTADVIMAAMCGYFILGFMWGFIYLFLETVHPGSFQIAKNGSGDQSNFIYFSFITMTTVGYGDTTPVSNAARALAVLEAVMGQLYIAVTIARLMGTYLSQRQEKQDGGNVVPAKNSD